MREAIWKAEIQCIDAQVVAMPARAEILMVQTQHGFPCLWFRVDVEAGLWARRIFTVGTGHPIPQDAGRYLGTYQLDDGRLVFHVFEEKRNGQ